MKFDFKDINLIPQKGIVNSRSDCDTSITFGNYNFKLPIVPSNMECVINDKLAIELSTNGYFYIMHRFNIDIIEFIENMNRLNLITSISVGVNEDSYNIIDEIYNKNLKVDYITIDIAHGHCLKMESIIKYIKKILPNVFLIAGNISTKEGVVDLENWGADSVKIGIGNGSVCTTYHSTGFGSRDCQASTIYECSKVAKKPIISDGGIKFACDITKSLVMGASLVMIGGMLSGFIDSPGKIIEKDGVSYKEFWGSASMFQSNKKNRIEGKLDIIKLKNKSLFDELISIEECLQSSISYSGGKDIKSLLNVKWN